MTVVDRHGEAEPRADASPRPPLRWVLAWIAGGLVAGLILALLIRFV